MDDLEFLKQEWERYNRIREAANKFLEEHEQYKGTEAYNLICLTSGACICFGLLFLCLVCNVVSKKHTKQADSPTPIKETL